MVKAPSSHGLDRKFRPWRRGASQNSKRRTSLKQQLRGHERLLKRTQDPDRRAALETQILEVQAEIATKATLEREKANARKSHGARFLERQKLVRAERNLRKCQSSSDKEDKSATSASSPRVYERELTKIALDQVYVAHYPMNFKYLPLFQSGKRRTDPYKVLAKRALTRQRIMASLGTIGLTQEATNNNKPKSWISAEQYERVVAISERHVSWTVDLEREYFGQAATVRKQEAVTDPRFQNAPQHEAVIALADQAEAKLETELKPGDNNGPSTVQPTEDSDDASKQLSVDDYASSSEDEADPLEQKQPSIIDPSERIEQAPNTSVLKEAGHKSSAEPCSSSPSSSSPSSSDDDSSDSESSDSTTEDSPSDDKKGNKSMLAEEEKSKPVEDFAFDDFLVAPGGENDHNVFAKPSEHLSAVDRVKGDKSQGWKTQRQRPGEYRNNANWRKRQR